MTFFKRDEMVGDAYRQGLKQFEDNPRRQFTWQELNEMVRSKPNIPAIAKEPPKKDSVCSLWLTWGRYDEKTGEVKEIYTKQSESFVANFLRVLNSFSIPQSMTNVSGNAITASLPDEGFQALAKQSSTSYGIVVGRSGDAVFTSQFSLSQKITNGTTSGLLQYAAMSWSSPQVSAPSATLQGSRAFTNGAISGPLSVLEAGIYVRTTNTSGFVVMIIRDTTNQTIASGQTNTATYTLKVTA